MSALTTTTVRCDTTGCDEWEPAAETAAGLRAARLNAARHGWTVHRRWWRRRDRCPDCSRRTRPAA